MIWALLGVGWAGVPEGLRAAVVPPSIIEDYDLWRKEGGLAGDRLVCGELLPKAALLCFRVWEGKKRRWVTESDLAAWKTSAEALRTEVARQAESQLYRIEKKPIVGMKTVYGLLADGDGWVAAPLLAPEATKSALGAGVLVAAVPAESVGLFWGGGNPEIDLIMAVGAKEIYETQPDGVSTTVFAWTGTAWVPFGSAEKEKPK